MNPLNLFINGHNVLFIIFVTFLLSVVLTPLSIMFAKHVGAVDVPDGKRKVHTKPIPSMGGLAIFVSFLIGYMLFVPKTDQILSVLIGGFIIVLTGICDDIKPLSPKWKLLGQIVAAVIVTVYGGLIFKDMQIFGHFFEFKFFAYPLTIFFIIAIINAINLTDGLDGLAAGCSSIYFITIAILGFIMQNLGGLDVILCLILFGSCLGFLIYNFSPALVFMGDTGSMFLGYIISVIALMGFKTATLTSLIIPMLLLFVPILDTLLAMGRRLLKGKSIGDADKEHLHHQLLKNTHSTKITVLIMYAINILFATVSIFYTLGDKKISICLYAILLLFFVILVLKTDILFDHHRGNDDKN
jgi:UDP-GlcNAc:undecaprenyl-phosphate GlcNAc-1-phosphate transferase